MDCELILLFRSTLSNPYQITFSTSYPHKMVLLMANLNPEPKTLRPHKNDRLLQAGCCCCTSSSCVLGPAGNYLAELAVQGMTEHQKPIWRQTTVNLLLMFASLALSLSILHWGTPGPGTKLTALLSFFLSFYATLWLFSLTYLDKVGFFRRSIAVFAQMFLSLVLFAAFSLVSALIGWGILDSLGYQLSDFITIATLAL